MGKLTFSIDELRDFIVKGKKHGYAGGGKKTPDLRRPSFHEYVYRRGVWVYRDGYTGLYSFFGSETVSFNKIPV